MNGSTKRDQVVERLLRQSPSTLASPLAESDACLDAETLAAWMDGGLSGVSLQTAEVHVADCARCQAIVAAVARTEIPINVSAGEGGTVDVGVRRWFGWLVPLTAAAAVLVLWVMVPRIPDTSAPESASARVESAPAAFPSASPTTAVPPAAPIVQEAPKEVTRSEAPSDERPPTVQNLERLDRAVEPPRREREAPPSAGADAASGRVAAAAPTASVAGGTLEERAVLADTPAPAAGPVAVVPTIVSPDPRVRWRLIGNRVERSEDSGVTWREVYQQPTVMLTTGTAPAANVCWIVGRGGAVILTTDGRTFAKVSFPNTLHLTAVTATDAQNATVRTVNGLTFATVDGGTTWAQR